MADIVHDFPIAAPIDRVFDTLCSPAGLDAWWTLQSEGKPGRGETYRLGFGPGHDWRAVMSRYEPGRVVEWEMTHADADWTGTRVGFTLEPMDDGTHVRFHHTGWPEANAHYRTSCFCWAMYLRLLTRHIERGEVVPCADRLSA